MIALDKGPADRLLVQAAKRHLDVELVGLPLIAKAQVTGDVAIRFVRVLAGEQRMSFANHGSKPCGDALHISVFE